MSLLEKNFTIGYGHHSYRISQHLGSGTFGEIYLAVHGQTRDEVAVKVEQNSVSMIYYLIHFISDIKILESFITTCQ